MTHLTGIVLTKNEAHNVVDCLATMRFCDDLIVFDSFSTDATVSLAESAGARVIQRAFDNYTYQRNAALDAVAGQADWVFFVDADERIPHESAQEIRTVIEKPGYAGWRIPRRNYIFGKETRGAGWSPDYQTRVLKVGQAHYDPSRLVHETVLLDGELGTLQEPLVHDNYQDLPQFLRKQHQYTAYEAQALYDSGVRPKPQNYLLQPLRHFRWRFLTLQGYRDGLHGLRLSLLMSWYEFRKYRMLQQLWHGHDTGVQTANDQRNDRQP
jgi:(heptosyl)LPS beta-1,4-glucosyltransferase